MFCFSSRARDQTQGLTHVRKILYHWVLTPPHKNCMVLHISITSPLNLYFFLRYLTDSGPYLSNDFVADYVIFMDVLKSWVSCMIFTLKISFVFAGIFSKSLTNSSTNSGLRQPYYLWGIFHFCFYGLMNIFVK